MIRPLLAVLALVFVTPFGRAQDWRDDDSIWGFGGMGDPHRTGPRPPDPPAIIPSEWIAIPATSDEPALLVVPWILDPTRPAPNHGEGAWTAKLTAPLGAAACAYTTVVCEADDVRMARLTGALWLVVNDSAHIGDPERRGDRGVPVALKKGENRIFVVDATAGWELELWKPRTRCVIGTWDVDWTRTGGEWIDMEFPVFNASLEPIEHLFVNYGHFADLSAGQALTVHQVTGGGVTPPLAMLRPTFYPDGLGGHSTPGGGGDCAPLAVRGRSDEEVAREVLCESDPSYERTRLSPENRALGRQRMSLRPQARIPTEVKIVNAMRVNVLVYGTVGSADETAALLARARLDQQVLWYACGEAPTILTDKVYLEHRSGPRTWVVQLVQEAPFALYGNSRVNRVWKELESVSQDTRAEQEAGPAPAKAEGLAGVVDFRMSAAPRSLPLAAVGFASTGLAGARLSLALAMLEARDDFVRVDPQSKTGFSPLASPK